MNRSFSLEGVFSAQWIPVNSQGQVNRAGIAAHLRFERERGISGLLALGSTGEFPFFSLEERKELLTFLAEIAAPLPVLAHITDIRPWAAIELGKLAKELRLPAVALMPPTFYPVSDSDLLAYFLEIADAVGLPMILYNFPELTGRRIDLATIIAFAERAPLLGMKQSGKEFDYHRELIATGRQMGFAVMSGADTRLTEVLGLGASGCIGGLVNIVPEYMVDLYRAHRGLAKIDVVEIARRMTQIGNVIDRLTFPLNVAAGIEARGYDPGSPKTIVSSESRKIYRGIVEKLRSLFSAWDLEYPAEARQEILLP